MPETTRLDGGRITLKQKPVSQETAFQDFSEAEVETISKDELYDLLRRHEPVQLVNVLDPKGYSLGSIKGSIRIPYAELRSRLMELNKEHQIVTYCANYNCELSRNAAKVLNAHGFCARAYEGGIEEWKDAGLAVDLH